MASLLNIINLSASTGKKEILKSINLEVGVGETHIIMGPNGSGKSTLAHILIGDAEYKIKGGDILYKGKSLLDVPVEKRAQNGIFLAFQNPVELPGVTMHHYLRLMYEARHGLVSVRLPGSWQKEIKDTITGRNKKNVTSLKAFREKVEETAKKVGLNKKLLERPVNEGFSGGEKKKSELLQMALLQPELVILDEIDSGLDINTLKELRNTINEVASQDASFIIITHHAESVFNIHPTNVHIMKEGRIVRTGDETILSDIREHGFDNT
jgi:Fe-S cluster assembly ATP-binding protein